MFQVKRKNLLKGIAGIALAYIVGMVVLQYLDLKDHNTRQDRARLQLGQYQKALDAFYKACGRYPSSTEGLNALIEKPSDCKLWGPDPYIKELAKDPWSRSFIYESSGDSYTLKTLGADGKSGSDGQNSDLSVTNKVE